jgi:hypothetical protein
LIVAERTLTERLRSVIDDLFGDHDDPMTRTVAHDDGLAILTEIEAELRDLARLRKALDTQTFVLEPDTKRPEAVSEHLSTIVFGDEKHPMVECLATLTSRAAAERDLAAWLVYHPHGFLYRSSETLALFDDARAFEDWIPTGEGKNLTEALDSAGVPAVEKLAKEASEARAALEARAKRSEAQDLKELLDAKREAASAQLADLEIKNIDAEPGVRDLLADVNAMIAEDTNARLQKAADEGHAEANRCDHGVTFDADAARGLGTREIRERWPRLDGPCPKGCGFNGIGYADFTHYLAGDW